MWVIDTLSHLCTTSTANRTYGNRAPASKATQQFVAGIKQFVGHGDVDAVDTFKHTVALLDDRLQSLVDEVLHDVWLATSGNCQMSYHQLFQLFLTASQTIHAIINVLTFFIPATFFNVF